MPVRPMSAQENPRLPAMTALGILAVLAAANLALFYPVFQMDYYSDDFAIIPIAQGTLGEMFALPDNPQSPMPDIYYRPLPMVTFWAIDALGIESPALNYGFNLILNIINGFLVVLLILQCIPERAGPWQRRVAVLAGLIASAGFVASYSVVWVSQRFDLMAALFVLLAIYLAVKYWRTGSAWALAGVFVAAVSGMLSKETAFFVPVLIIAWYIQERLLQRGGQPAFGRMAGAAAISGLAAATVIGIRIAADVQFAKGLISSNLLRMPYGYVKSAIELLSPIRLGSVYGAYADGHPMQVAVIFLTCCAMITPVLYLLWRGLKRHGWLTLLGVLLPVFAAVTLFALRGYQVPRLMYLAYFILWASIGSMLAFGSAPLRKSVFTALFAVLILQAVSSRIVTRYYANHSAHVDSELLPAVQRLDGSRTFMFAQVHTRLLFRHHGLHVMAPMATWEDPVYEWLFYGTDTPKLGYTWLSSHVLEITEPMPNRFFHMAEGTFGLTTSYAPGDAIAMPGYRVIVERVAMGDKVKSVLIEFDPSRSVPPLYMDDEVQLKKLR